MAPISATIFTRLIGTGMERAGSFIFQKIIRLRKINTAITSGRYQSPGIQSALKDFETVIGSYQGALDEPLDRFLREFERSGLITACAERALVGSSDPDLKKAFIELHENVCGKGVGQASKLFDSLMLSFRVTFSEKLSDPQAN